MKQTLVRNKKYLEWIRQQPCCVTHGYYDVQAHHITVFANRGISQKPSDLWCVPLNAVEHMKLHSTGERSFWSMHRLDPHALATKFVIKWMTEKHPDDNLSLLRYLNEYATDRYL